MKPRRLIPAAVLAATLAGPIAAQAAPSVQGEYSLNGAKPGRITVDKDGNAWAVLIQDGNGKDVARVTPSGTVDLFDVSDVSTPSGIAYDATTNTFWVSQSGGVAKFSPAAPTVGTAFPIAGFQAGPLAFAYGSLWSASADTITRITTAGVKTDFPAAGLQSRDVQTGEDGKLYVTDFSLDPNDPGHVLRVAADGSFVERKGGLGMLEATAAPNGQIAYSAPVDNPRKVGLINDGATEPKTVDQAADGQDATGVAYGLDGAFWFGNFSSHTLTRLTPSGELTVFKGLTNGSEPRFVAAGPGGVLWVTEENDIKGRKIAKIVGLEAPKVDTPGNGGGTPTTTTGTGTTPPPPPPDTTKPVISKLSVTKVLKRRRTSTIKLTSSEAGVVNVDVQLAFPGRRNSAGRCVAPSSKNRGNRRCDHYYSQKRLKATMTGTTATLKFKRALLPKGRYRIVVTVTDAAGNVSAQRTAAFTATKR